MTALNRRPIATRPWATFAVLGALVLAIVGLAQTHPGRRALHSLGVTGSHSGYTELAFADPTRVPPHVPRGVSRQNVTFAIHNAEGQVRVYQWRVLVADDTHSETVATGRVRVGVRQTAHVATNIRLRCAARRARVKVELRQPSESIGYWTQCVGTSASGSA